jgi:hypothetical protein
MEQPYEFLVVLRRGDADAVIVDDPQIARAIGRVIARHLGGAPPREAPAGARPPAPRSPARAGLRPVTVRGPGAPDGGTP